MTEKIEIPEDQIAAVILGLSEKTQHVLLRTVWKDGIDIEVPTFDAIKFTEWIACPFIERISRLTQENAALKAENERLKAPLSPDESYSTVRTNPYGEKWIYLTDLYLLIAARAASIPDQKRVEPKNVVSGFSGQPIDFDAPRCDKCGAVMSPSPGSLVASWRCLSCGHEKEQSNGPEPPKD